MTIYGNEISRRVYLRGLQRGDIGGRRVGLGLHNRCLCIFGSSGTNQILVFDSLMDMGGLDGVSEVEIVVVPSTVVVSTVGFSFGSESPSRTTVSCSPSFLGG
ncbi:hypothetical protein L6452_32195 [Arctium lappa]|uniref:Uncharacterized protein n=1 Tax=Arctium lappa TaxID=4217 RepID=A0ACB8Z4S6_ARCLA|nr:hypothetical protein L6452_32195 [Arctium lappa]